MVDWVKLARMIPFQWEGKPPETWNHLWQHHSPFREDMSLMLLICSDWMAGIRILMDSMMLRRFKLGILGSQARWDDGFNYFLLLDIRDWRIEYFWHIQAVDYWSVKLPVHLLNDNNNHNNNNNNNNNSYNASTSQYPKGSNKVEYVSSCSLTLAVSRI